MLGDFSRRAFRFCDLTICRDALPHLPNETVLRSLHFFAQTSRYLLASSFDGADNFERNIVAGEFAFIDLKTEPFGLGQPIARVEEKFRGKYLGLWEFNSEAVGT